MGWYELDIEPRDLFFFRDAKPMAASSVGKGARWPWPNTLHDSFMAAFHGRWPQRQPWEFEHKHRNDSDRNWNSSSMRFGGLRSVGVFPVVDDELCFTKPADISNDGTNIAALHKRSGESDLPGFLEYTVLNAGEPSKQSAGEWLTAAGLEAYLRGELIVDELKKSADIYDVESRFGIAIDPMTGTADKGAEDEGGKVYIAEYMRLRENAGMRGFVNCISSLRGDKSTDVMAKFFDGVEKAPLVFGGQRGVATVSRVRSEKPLPFELNNVADGLLVKWVLLTPAVFSGGWKPGWIDDTGRVRLWREKLPRREGESRGEWRARCRTEGGGEIDAILVAARVDKPLAFSGWSLASGGPRATRLAVPAGSVYYFRCASGDDAKALVKSLQGHCKSDFYGEKGFGFGLCGSWE